jgi:hypothetical protein
MVEAKDGDAIFTSALLLLPFDSARGQDRKEKGPEGKGNCYGW